MNAVDLYMEQVDETLKNTTDPFAKKYNQLFKDVIRKVAMDNWISDGEPTLTKEQMDDVYIKVKNQSSDKTWAIVGPFNVCMN